MNRFYKILLTYALTCACTINGIETTASPERSTTQLEKYSNSEKGYSIDFPSDWKKSDVPQLDLVLFAPQKTGEIPLASMNIVSEKVGDNINLEQFYSESASNLSSALKDVHVEKSGSSQLNGTQSKWILYTHTLQGMKFRVLQYFAVANDTIFLITFSSSIDDFETYRAEFDKMANSFRITAAMDQKNSGKMPNMPTTTNSIKS